MIMYAWGDEAYIKIMPNNSKLRKFITLRKMITKLSFIYHNQLSLNYMTTYCRQLPRHRKTEFPSLRKVRG